MDIPDGVPGPQISTAVDDDPVVTTIDVFLNQKHGDSLYIFQYPTYSSTRPPYDEGGGLQCRFKPSQRKVELDVPLDTNPLVYNAVRAEELAQAHLGEEPSEEDIAKSAYPSGRMDKLTLCSAIAPLEAHYCVAVMDERGLHLTPVGCVAQLRPGMRHRDTPGEGIQADSHAADSEDEVADGTAITVKVQTTRERRLAAIKAARAEPDERWQSLEVVAANRDGDPSRIHAQLGAGPTDTQAVFGLSRQQYLQAINAVNATRTQGPDEEYSKTGLCQYKMADRVRRVMCHAQVARLHEVAELAAARTDDVLAILQDVAVLVHGNWVVKSEVLYPDNYRSPTSGVPASAMRLARDYIIYKLHEMPNDRPPAALICRERPTAFSRPQAPYKGDNSQNHYAHVIKSYFAEDEPGRLFSNQEGGKWYLRRSDVAQAMTEWHVRVEVDDLVGMLRGVGLQVQGRGWVFRNKTDQEFITTHPRIVERQKEAQAKRFQQMHDQAIGALHPRRPTLTAHPTSDADAAIRSLFERDGVVTFSGLRQYAEKCGVKAGELHAFLMREAKELKLTWWQPCVTGQDKVYVLATQDEIREQRDVVLGMFCERQSIKRAEAQETCKAQTGKELPTSVWQKITKEIGVRRGGNWDLKLPST